MRHNFWAWLIAVAVAASACSGGQPSGTAAIAAAPGAAAEPAATSMPGMAHGDHNAHHGGVVYMYEDMHYEVVLDTAGHHRVYFSDATREDLPASVASSVTLTVERPGSPPEALQGRIDEQGESWMLDGRPVGEKDASARLAFGTRGREYWIDVPFIAKTP